MVEKNSYIYEYVPKYVFYIILILTILEVRKGKKVKNLKKTSIIYIKF